MLGKYPKGFAPWGLDIVQKNVETKERNLEDYSIKPREQAVFMYEVF